MKNPKTSPQSAEGQGLDPLEELARIMNDTNTPNPNKRPEDASKPEDDPLDLGLGDQGLAELFGDQRFDDDPVLSTSFEAELDQAAAEPADALFKDLDFSEVDLPGLDDPAPVSTPPATPPAPADENPDVAAIPSLTDHLTPRAEPTPPPVPPAHGRVQEDDLLAAMDALALDEPPASQPRTPVPPLPYEQPDAPAPAFAAPTAADEPSGFDAGGAHPDADDYQPAFEEFGDTENDGERSDAGKLVLFALAGVALLGIGGVIVFGLISSNGGQDTAPQVIAAAEGDDKIEPVASEDTQSQPGDAVFSSLDDGAASQGTTPRVILPQPDSDGLPLRSGERLPSVDIAPAAPGSTASRAVRTVTVRADGTVVESTTPAAATPASAEASDVQVEAAEPRPVEIVSVSPSGASVNTQPIADAVSAAQSAAQSTIETTTDAAASAAQAALDEATRAVTPAAPPAPVVRPATAPVQSQPAQIAAIPAQPATPQQSSTPIQLATPAAAPTQPVTPQPTTPQPTSPQPVVQQQAAVQPAATPATLPASVPAGDFVVQLASLRSEEEARATFGRLQNRFGSILSGFGPNIQRADLGDRGIYHRVRIGPMDRAAADSLCQRYQSAGGDCFVQRQ